MCVRFVCLDENKAGVHILFSSEHVKHGDIERQGHSGGFLMCEQKLYK